jgi:uncharacterized protein involved in exopolysaccharide biosynthesis
MLDGSMLASGPGGRPSREIALATGREVDYWTTPTETVDESPDLSLNLREYWRILLKHKWIIAIIAAAALALGGAATLLTTPIYTAVATLQIDRETARIVAGQDVQPQEQMIAGEEFFQTQYGLLRSRSLTIRVMETLGLARSDQFLTVMGVNVDEDATPSSRRNRVIGVLQQGLSVDPVRGSRLVSVSFASPQPQLSATVANAFAENFIASNLDRRFESSSYARDFLEKRLAQVKARLEETERQLVAYATSQQIINLSDGREGADSGTQSLAAADLAALNAALATAKSNRIAAEERWRQSQRTTGFGTTEVLTSPTVQQLSQSRLVWRRSIKTSCASTSRTFPRCCS